MEEAMQMDQEPQKELKKNHPRPHARNPHLASTTPVAAFQKATYAREICFILGGLFITLGLVGFVVPDLLQAHLSGAHNAIHLISGLGAVICAYLGAKPARYFAFGFGAVYGVLGALGFILGSPGESAVAGHMGRDSALWVLSPGVLEFGAADHTIHLVIAAIFLIAATLPQQRRSKTPVWYH